MNISTLFFVKFFCILLLCSSCSPQNDHVKSRTVEAIKKSGSLKVLTRNAPNTRYVGRHGDHMGPEHDMTQAFGAYLGVSVEYVQKESIEEIIEALRKGEGDLAAAGLTRTDQRTKEFLFGPSYQDITQQVVCRRDNVQPESAKELIGLKIGIISGSSYEESLNALKEKHAELTWEVFNDVSTEKLFQSVWNRNLDCTIADSNIVDLNRRYYPELIAPFNLDRSQSLAWMLPRDSENLKNSIEDWHKSFASSGRLKALMDQYYGFFEVFDYVDTKRLIRRIESRYSKYKNYFESAAKKYQISLPLLAAQGYQESHWQADAVSPTGVKGIMMLTIKTAESVGVSDRLDPKQSIEGGAKYLAKLRKNRFSEEITEPDRTWLALAAYNIGRAHLHDAQTLARQQNLNPHLWSDIKQVLPLLAQKRYYQNLKYGYARGTEPVRYVQRIREYEHIIKKHTQSTLK